MSDLLPEFFRSIGWEDTPKNRLAFKITLYWIKAVKSDDFKWMKAYLKEMRRLENLGNLERLEKLYDWCKLHPVGRS